MSNHRSGGHSSEREQPKPKPEPETKPAVDRDGDGLPDAPKAPKRKALGTNVKIEPCPSVFIEGVTEESIAVATYKEACGVLGSIHKPRTELVYDLKDAAKQTVKQS